MSLACLHLSLAIEELVCDPPCSGNRVCRNYSGTPECVCADGFTGEDNCTGMLDHISLEVFVSKWQVILENRYFLLLLPGVSSLI